MRRAARAAFVLAALAATDVRGPSLVAQSEMAGPVGLQEAAWAPDGKRIAVSYLDRIWSMTPDGRQPKVLGAGGADVIEREPVWSPDGSRVAFSANRGTGFDIFVASARGGPAAAVTTMAGDERWPSWTNDGRLVFSHREPAPADRSTDPGSDWDLYLVAPVRGSDAWQAPVALTATPDNETYPRVSPNGRTVVFVSNRESDDDVDVWALPLPSAAVTKPVPLGARPSSSTGARSAQADARSEPADAEARRPPEKGPRPPRPVRVTRTRGIEAYPSWAPDNQRIAFYAVREGVGSIWVATVEAATPGPGDDPVARPHPSATPQLVSRRGGAPAWSPDGRTLLVTGLPDPQPVYNGNPLRSEIEPPPLFAVNDAFRLWRVPAPLPVHEDGGSITSDLRPTPALMEAAFDRAWRTLRDLYYSSGPSADAWKALGTKYRPRAVEAHDTDELEAVLDDMVGEQPLIKPVITSAGAVVVSGHPLASEAGRLALEKGGNIVDAMIAVSFALGVVEPEASGLGGDGSAVLYMKGMQQPTVIDYKDQTPIHATPDNPAIVQDGRIIADGPAAANIPGVVAGLDHLYHRYGSGKVKWAELVAPAIKLADEGFILDESLPTSIAEGRRFLEKYPAAARIFLPGGKVPKPGDRFVNRDYASTLRIIAREGGETFYRGEIAKRIAADMENNGGIIRYADLAQYRAIERAPVQGHYRGHTLYAGGPPVSTGIQLFESLHVLEQYQAKAGARITTDPDYFHYLIEAWKVRDPMRRVADPERWPVDYAQHLTDEHARTLFQKIDAKEASRYERQTPDDEPFLQRPDRIGTGTTSFAVADAEGNMIAVTQTLSTWGGTFYVSRGLGFLYNNHLRSNRITAGAYGSLLPLMRSSTASVPTLVFQKTAAGEVPKLAVGCAGNAWIPLSVYNVITSVIDGGLSAQAAIEAPRFLPSRDPADPLDSGARIEIEDRFPRTVLDELESRGHRFQKIGRKGEVRYGYAAAIVVDPAAHRVTGGAEPRRAHAAVPFNGKPTTTQ
jgi:gamma-glutamyltranspeptidase